MRTECGVSAEFPVTVGLHQEESVLSHFLFVLVLDVLIETVRKEELWELLHTDDLGILAETTT